MLAISSHAGPITYTFTGTASGVAGATSFTDSPFTISLFADTANVIQIFDIPGDTVFSVNASSSSINIGGVGVGNILTDLRFFVNQPSNTVGIAIANDGGDLFDIGLHHDPALAAVATYDLTTSLGPLTVTNPASIADFFGDVQTTFGTVWMGGSSFPVTFTATVPEPSSIGLCTLALLSVMAWRSSKRKMADITRPNLRAGGDGGMTPLLNAERPGPAAPHHEG
jgi:hypothetical protein